jgi:hypothetical protein
MLSIVLYCISGTGCSLTQLKLEGVVINEALENLLYKSVIILHYPYCASEGFVML